MQNKIKEGLKASEQLENRIKRLAFESERAQKVTDQVTQNAEKLLAARERHQLKLDNKNRLD